MFLRPSSRERFSVVPADVVAHTAPAGCWCVCVVCECVEGNGTLGTLTVPTDVCDQCTCVCCVREEIRKV